MSFSEEHHGKNPRWRGWIVKSGVIFALVLVIAGTGYTMYRTGNVPTFMTNLLGLEQPSDTPSAGN